MRSLSFNTPFPEFIMKLSNKQLREIYNDYRYNGDCVCTYSYYAIYCLLDWGWSGDFAKKFRKHWDSVFKSRYSDDNKIEFYFNEHNLLTHKIKEL